MFSPATGYAAIALGYLVECDGAVARVEDIAAACNIPAAYLGKIMHTLARKGFVKSRRGVGGGIMLTCDPATTSLLDLCQALDDPATDHRCMLGIAPCSDERACPAHEFWTKQCEDLINFADRTTIQTFTGFEQQQRALINRSKQTGSPPRKRSASDSRKTSRKQPRKGGRS
jgi:Rrf2 family transcriptional regulator, iron-sulfur cluster assembly transcription factor